MQESLQYVSTVQLIAFFGHSGTKWLPLRQVGDADPHSASSSMQIVGLGASEVNLHQPSRRDAATLTEAERRPRPGGGGSRRPDEGTRRAPREDDDSGMDFSEEEGDHLAKRRPREGRQPGCVEMRGRRTQAPDRFCPTGVLLMSYSVPCLLCLPPILLLVSFHRDGTEDLKDYAETRARAQSRCPRDAAVEDEAVGVWGSMSFAILTPNC